LSITLRKMFMTKNRRLRHSFFNAEHGNLITFFFDGGLLVKALKSCHITPILRSLHWLRINERVKYKLLSLTYKVLTITQPPYLHNLISVQCLRRLFVVLALHPSLLLFGHRHHLLLKLLIVLFDMLHRVSGIIYSSTQPHSGTSFSISDSPIPSPTTSSTSVSPLCSSITHSVFHPRLKTYLCHKSYPPLLVLLLPPGLSSRTFKCTVSSELIGFCF